MTKKDAILEAIDMLGEIARMGNDRASEVINALTRKRKIKRDRYDLVGCKFFKTKGKKTLRECAGDGHYRCKECVNLSVPLDEREKG